MDGKQYDESLLAILTFCESLEKPVYHDLQEEQFGMSKHLFVQTVSELNRNNVIKADPGNGYVLFFPLTEKGREKLEQLREKIWNHTWYMRTWHWICDIWWIHVPVLIATLYYSASF